MTAKAQEIAAEFDKMYDKGVQDGLALILAGLKVYEKEDHEHNNGDNASYFKELRFSISAFIKYELSQADLSEAENLILPDERRIIPGLLKAVREHA
jgi:hypothetical protein